MKKTIVASVIGFILLSIVMIILAVLNQQGSSQQSAANNDSKVTFIYTPLDGAEVSLHQNKNQTSTDGEPGEKIADITPNSTITLKNDKNYVIKIAGQDIQAYTTVLYLNSPTVKRQIYISRTPEYLASVKQSEGDEITESAKNQLQKWLSLYDISPDSVVVVDDGSWAVVKLTYKGSVTLARDSLFAILHKKDGSWQVVAGPEIVISKPDHPDIPSAAILEAAPTEPPAK